MRGMRGIFGEYQENTREIIRGMLGVYFGSTSNDVPGITNIRPVFLNVPAEYPWYFLSICE